MGRDLVAFRVSPCLCAHSSGHAGAAHARRTRRRSSARSTRPGSGRHAWTSRCSRSSTWRPGRSRSCRPPSSTTRHRSSSSSQRRLLVHTARWTSTGSGSSSSAADGDRGLVPRPHSGADAWGVDVAERRAWAALADERTRLVCANLAPLTVRSSRTSTGCSRPRSSSTWSTHMPCSGSCSGSCGRAGMAWSANLHRGPQASHLSGSCSSRSRTCCSATTSSARSARHHAPEGAGARVNKLTWSQYEDYLREIGFVILSLRFREARSTRRCTCASATSSAAIPMGPGPDFFYVVLEKPSGTAKRRRG